MRRDPFKKMLEKKAPVIRVEPVSLGSAGAKFLVGNNIEKTSSFPGYAEAVEKLIKMREKAGQGRAWCSSGWKPSAGRFRFAWRPW